MAPHRHPPHHRFGHWLAGGIAHWIWPISLVLLVFAYAGATVPVLVSATVLGMIAYASAAVEHPEHHDRYIRHPVRAVRGTVADGVRAGVRATRTRRATATPYAPAYRDAWTTRRESRRTAAKLPKAYGSTKAANRWLVAAFRAAQIEPFGRITRVTHTDTRRTYHITLPESLHVPREAGKSNSTAYTLATAIGRASHGQLSRALVAEAPQPVAARRDQSI